MLSTNYETNGVLKRVTNLPVNVASYLDLGQMATATSSLAQMNGSEWTSNYYKSSLSDDRSDQENEVHYKSMFIYYKN